MYQSTNFVITFSFSFATKQYSGQEREYSDNFINETFCLKITLSNDSLSQATGLTPGTYDRSLQRLLNTSHKTKVVANLFLICREPTGRLGNQMFDFASALGIARTLNYSLVIRPTLLLWIYLKQTNDWSERNLNMF